jgi:hypothetical protein
VNIGKVADTIRFRRHVVVHLPPNERLLNGTSDVEEERLWWIWSWVGQVLWEEGRWKEGEELDVKLMEARRRLLGEEHPDTIRVTADLAYTKRALEQNDAAIDSMTRSATASSRVLGYNHPDWGSRHEQAAFWSSVTSDDDGDDDQDIDQDVDQAVYGDDDGGVAVNINRS